MSRGDVVKAGAAHPCRELSFHHVDVFSHRPLSGNGLAVVVGDVRMTTETMHQIAQELRQFETIFLSELTSDGAVARIFTPEEELQFAGHPVLGAAAVLHTTSNQQSRRSIWKLRVGARSLRVTVTSVDGGSVAAEMDQGPVTLSPALSLEDARRFGSALGLRAEHLRTDLPTRVASTGLPYLLVPVTVEGLAASHVATAELPSMLDEVGADFAYVLDPDRPEGRTWDLRGITEDVATGSAAGPAAGYLIDHGLRPAGEPFDVHQGQFVGRPSRMHVRRGADGSVHVGGPVARFISGRIEVPPGLLA